MPPQFLNVDLILRSRSDLTPLLAIIEKQAVVLHHDRIRGVHHASIELLEFSRYVEPETCIARFARLVEALPPAARRIWDRASDRRFDVGIEAKTLGTYSAAVSAKTLRRVAELGGSLAITVYAVHSPSRSRATT